MENSQSAVQVYMKNQGLDILPDNNQYKNRFNIKSESSNRLYVIAQRISDGAMTCSCPGWIRARNGHENRTCKHIRTLAPLLNAMKEIEKKQIG
jgi:predicted nucleic acid-binding Zn finger protein